MPASFPVGFPPFPRASVHAPPHPHAPSHPHTHRAARNHRRSGLAQETSKTAVRESERQSLLASRFPACPHTSHLSPRWQGRVSPRTTRGWPRQGGCCSAQAPGADIQTPVLPRAGCSPPGSPDAEIPFPSFVGRVHGVAEFHTILCHRNLPTTYLSGALLSYKTVFCKHSWCD